MLVMYMFGRLLPSVRTLYLKPMHVVLILVGNSLAHMLFSTTLEPVLQGSECLVNYQVMTMDSGQSNSRSYR